MDNSAYSLEIEGLVSHKHKLEAEIGELRAEVERLTGERDEWKAKWVALGQASMILGTISRQAAEIERLKAHQNATMCMLHADCADGCKHAEIERLKAENARLYESSHG